MKWTRLLNCEESVPSTEHYTLHREAPRHSIARCVTVRRMASSGMLSHVALVINDVSEERSATLIWVASISSQRASVTSYSYLSPWWRRR
jgi:hypothetical protein